MPERGWWANGPMREVSLFLAGSPTHCFLWQTHSLPGLWVSIPSAAESWGGECIGSEIPTGISEQPARLDSHVSAPSLT